MGVLLILIEMLIVLGIVIFTLGFLAFKIIPLAINLLKIRIRKAEDYVARESTQKIYYPRNGAYKQPEWTSEWKWDEASQTWVHPRSKKPEPRTSNEYTITEDEIDRINKRYQTATTPEPEVTIDFAHAYQAQPLFTRNEWQNYKTLKDVAEVKGYVICPKVRLLDIVRPRNGAQKYKTLLYKIQSKHVDFVICDQNMTIKAIIELDDSTHDTQKGQERDAFIDTVLRSVGYKVIHTRYINRDILDLI